MYKKYIKNNKKLQNYANKIIPGLSGLLGKRPEMYLPGGKWPTYYSKAKGINIWDLNGSSETPTVCNHSRPKSSKKNLANAFQWALRW